MKLPKPGAEIVFARDRYHNQILLHGNPAEEVDEGGPAFDLQTDGRVCLTPELARELATQLRKFAKAAEAANDKRGL